MLANILLLKKAVSDCSERGGAFQGCDDPRLFHSLEIMGMAASLRDLLSRLGVAPLQDHAYIGVLGDHRFSRWPVEQLEEGEEGPMWNEAVLPPLWSAGLRSSAGLLNFEPGVGGHSDVSSTSVCFQHITTIFTWHRIMHVRTCGRQFSAL